MADYKNAPETDKVFNGAYQYCTKHRNEFLTPEHLLLAMLAQSDFSSAFIALGYDYRPLQKQLMEAIKAMEQVPEDIPYKPQPSHLLQELLITAKQQMIFSEVSLMGLPHLTAALLQLEESQAAFFLRKLLGNEVPEFMAELIETYGIDAGYDDDTDFDEEEEEASLPWRNLVTCINETYLNHNPLIGREAELERTIQVLCRKDKNNPLHVGEPGVGKTAIVYGLAAMIERGEVPERLKESCIYQMDMGTMLAGTQFRGDFEKRIKQVMDGVEKEGNAIVYIDEIHNLVGAGRTGDGSMDASNMLKPYLESGKIRFIGSTTYAEYNRYFAKSAGIVRRFQQIDIAEPSIEQTVDIVNGLKKKYEKFHGVKYSAGVIDFAVRSSAKHIHDRFLPDKAIDLIDEAGAYREIHPIDAKTQTVDKTLVSEILAKVCKIEAAAMKEENNESLKTLQQRIRSKIYGQDEAVNQVVEAVQMAKAGLMEDDKPLASLLFVGPTGVGKTEVARVLTKELGIELVRFDMSEYTEKHAVAKLIGSPAGYVGYEDGGLLTDAIRKNPNCVLLLDEIEKAHQDIYNILLQVMDYAKLTDNKGQKADFRNVILIMTSNAGAQYASQANVGFSGNVSRGEAMLAQVKKTFKPEFINRLSATVVFRDMDKHMASLILQKKLNELHEKLAARKVEMTLSEEAEEFLLKRGFTPQYGAREMDRIIASLLKPLLTREILFGKLRKGGRIRIGLTKEKDTLTTVLA